MAGDEVVPGTAPCREEVEALPGPTVIELGARWCGHCQAVQPLLAQALAEHPQVRHLAIEDGPGKRLGRSYRVKLWPTLVFLDDGQEIARLVRPRELGALRAALEQIAPARGRPDR
jgi:thioredoxin 1